MVLCTSMNFKPPKNSDRFAWTRHAIEKMQFYGLSETKVKSVISRPQRVEEGVALKTSAVMQRTGSKKHPTEIWVMYQPAKRANSKSQVPNYKQGKLKIISTWRYPGVSPVREVPMPQDVICEVLRQK